MLLRRAVGEQALNFIKEDLLKRPVCLFFDLLEKKTDLLDLNF